MRREKSKWKIACILFVALLIAPLIAFGATQNLTEQEQNITLPENIITSEHVAELNETPSEDNRDGTTPIQPLQTPENATDNTTDNATGVTLQTPENATDNTTGNATGVSIQTPENATDNTTDNATGISIQTPENATDNNTTGNATGVSIQTPENVTDNTTVIGLNYTINESTGESRNINVTESVIGTPKLIANKESFSLDEEPVFSFEYKTFRKSFIKNVSQKTCKNVTENASREMLNTVSEKAAEAATGAPQKALKRWMTANETIETCVYDSSGALTDIAPEIAKIGEGKFVIELPKERAFRAGVYTLSVELVKDEHVYVLESEFPWGLVSLNTKKSIYKPEETAEFVIVALDKAGHSVSNADISLTVTNPNNDKTTYSCADGTITASSECGIYNLDYHTELEGNHTVFLTALIDNVEVSFDTYFRVQQAYEFDLVRTTQSKIDPTLQDLFEVRIDVECLTDAESVTLKEFVPAEFCVYSTDAATVMQEDDTKTITWHKELTDKKTSVSYSYAVPPVWPYLYALGPAEISHGTETFTEARPWYVAVDPISIINVQSYPAVGGNWSVKFETVGIADLTITAVDGTTWTNQPYECYDEETEILTKDGWKLFKDLDAEEEVLTLNPETKAQEWQKPVKYLEYDYSDAMFELTLADGSQLLVSPEHKVYGAMVDRNKNLLIGFIMVNQSVKDDGILFNPEKQNKASDLDSLVITHISPEIFEVVNRNPLKSSDLVDLLLNTPEQGGIRPLESFHGSGEFIGRDNLHKSSHQLLNSSKVMVFLLPDLSSFNTTSVDLTTSLANDSLTSRLSSAGISDICAAFLSNSSSSISSILSENAFSATEGQLTHSNLSICPSNSFEILIFNSPMPLTKNNKDSEHLNTYSLLKISELHELPNNQLVFLDSELNPVAVKKIEEVPYTGKIYSVTVQNRILLVRRGNSTPVWCGNSNYDLQFLELKCGNRTLEYQWLNDSVFIQNYECNETGYETSKVLTAGSHHLKFQFGSDVEYAHNWATNLSNWSYRQNISISNTAGNLSYYQIKIELNSLNIGTNWNWSNNGNDIRFTYYNSSSETETEIPFWIESWDSTAETSTIWVKVTYLENNADTTIYLYYGNTSASSASNGTNTFEFFDDFESFNLDDWGKENSGSTLSQVSDPAISGRGQVLKYDGNGWYAFKKTTYNFTNGTIHFEFYRPSSNKEIQFCWRITGISPTKNLYEFAEKNQVLKFQKFVNNEEYKAIDTESITCPANTWHNSKIVANGSSIEYWVDGTEHLSFSDTSFSSGNLGGRCKYDIFFNDIFVCKYASPEPTVTIGSEEAKESNYTEFNSSQTTDFNNVADITNVSNATLQTNTAKITWCNNVNAYGADFDTNVDFGFAFVDVNSTGLNSTFNSSANVTLYNLLWSETPVIFEDGSPCPDCTINFYSGGNLSFNVTHFTNYSAGANANLTIWDDTDPEGGSQTKYSGNQIKFYANYTNITSGESINGSGVYCNISFDVTPNGPYDMIFNSSSLLYEYNRSFSSSGTFNWNVTCNGSVLGYEDLNITDTVTVSTSNNPPAITLNEPDNGSSTPNNWTILNATVTDADTDNTTVYFYANNNSNGLNDSEGLVHIGENVANETTLTYNLTALPIKPSEDGLVLLMHFDNRSEFGEHTQKNVANAVYDFSENGNNGTLGSAIANTAPDWNVTGGKFAGAFEFDGINDYISCEDDPLLDITNDLTLEAWVNFDTISSSDYYTGIVAKWCWGCGGMSYGLFKDPGTPNYFAFHIWDDSNKVILSDSVFETDTWYHVVGTYNGTTMVMYVNGVKQTQTLNSGNIATSTSPVTIGIFDNNNNFCIDGSIDEVAIYNRSLSATEILNHYRLGEGKYYWKVNASDGVLSNESEVWEFTVATQPVISSYTPAKQLRIQDERGTNYKQSYHYLQKSRTLNASATLSSTNGVGGVRFIVDQGEAGETIVNDTNTSDTLFSAQFSSLCYGNHTIDITIFDTSQSPLSGSGQTESIDPFWIVPYIIQFVGDSITISCEDDTTCDVLKLADVTSGCNAVTSENFLELPCWDANQNVYSNGIHIFYSDYAKSIYGTYVFGNNEAQSGITAAGTHDKFIANNNGYAYRFTSLDENSSNADLFGPTHAYVMLGLNDKYGGVSDANYEIHLTSVVNDIHNQSISYENITLLYPTYSSKSGYDVSNYLDNIDNVVNNLGTKLITDLYNETKDNYDNSEKSWYFTDDLHFTRAGSQNISGIIAEKSTWLNTGKATYTVFNGSGTTDFNNLPDITNVSDAALQTSTARITWYNNVNAYGADFDTNVDFGFAFVDVNSTGLNSTFNSSANVTLYNLLWSKTPAIFEDGSPCPDCTINFYSGGNLSFNVTHFTNYSAGANANLTIWDATDPEGGSQTKYPGNQIKFYANYTNKTSGQSINGTGVYCNISFNVTLNGPFGMTFNDSSLLYEYNRTFSSAGTYEWNVTCNGSVQDYEELNVTDTVTVSTSSNAPAITLNKPDNGSTTTNSWAILNATVTDADNDNMTVYFYANNNSNGLNDSEGLVYIGENVANGTTLTYNLTALPIKPSEANLSLLMHFDNRSEYGENSTHTYDFSGNGNNGSCSGTVCPTWNVTGGKFAGAFVFDGTDDYINVGDVMPSGAYTKVAWVKRVAGADWYNIISGNDYHAFWAPNLYSFNLSAGHNGTWNIVEDSVALEVGKWYHVAVTFDPAVSSGQMVLYKNGAQVDNATSVATQGDSSTTYIGRFSSGHNWNGTIDEVAIYNRALSSAEIKAHYALGDGKYYWKVNASDGVLSNESDVFEFTVSTQANANLSIWDDTDPEGGSQTKYINNKVCFYANYTNKTSGGSINGSGVYCNISFNVTPKGPFDMPFNYSSLLYEYNRTFSSAGTYEWNVTCNGSVQSYDVLNATDTVTISTTNNPPAITLNKPDNGSTIPNNWTILNATVADADDDPMTVYFYANNNSNGLNASEGLVYIGENVANGTTLTYNLTALPIKPSEANLSLLMHFDNRSEFGENSTHTYDFSGNGNNGSCSVCPTWNVTGGKFAGAFVFDGTDDYVSVNNDPSLRITGPLTLEAWVNFNSLGSSSHFKGIVAKWNWGGSGFGYGLFKTASVADRIAFHLASGQLSGNVWVASNSVPSPHEWYHVIGTYDGTNMLLYINGEVQTDTNTTTGIYNNSEPVTIGRFDNNNNYCLDGAIDEVAIYNRTLSADEILNHYRLGEGKYYWKVNATDGVLSNESKVGEFYIGADQTAPSIQLNYPDDKANLSTSTVDFNWTATDNYATTLLCNLTIDGVVNQSDINSTSGQPTNYSVSGLSTGVHNWSVTCRDNVSNEGTSATRTFGVNDTAPNVTLNKPDNGSSTPNSWTILNATVTDADGNPMTVYFYANNNSNGLNDSDGLVYIGENVANGTTLAYNLTALPIKPSEANLSLLMHFDNRSEFGEHTHRNVANAVYDFSGNGNNGTLGNAIAGTAPTWNVTGGKFAGAFEFDGGDDSINCGNDPMFDITNDLTVEAWVNFNTTSSYYTAIVAKWCDDCGGQSYGLFKETGASNNFSFHIWDGSINPNRWILSDSVFATDIWYHVVGTYNGTTMLMYVNGVQQTQTLNCGNNIVNSTSPVTIGIFDNNNNFCLDGAIDEVAIYNRTLSASEIRDHYRLGGGKYYWKVNATDGVLSNESDVWNFSVFSETLEIKNQTASQSISSINFSGATGATVTDPYNNADGSGSPQNMTSKTPVVTIYNPSSSASYKIWLKVEEVSGWSTIINDEKFNVTADDTSPGAVSSWTTLKSWGDYKDSGVTVSVGTYKDLYLAYELKGSGTGTSTVSVLGEAV